MSDQFREAEEEFKRRFEETYFTTKSRLLAAIEREKDAADKSADNEEDGSYAKRYYKTLASYLKTFHWKVSNSYLFEKLNDWWSYVFYIGSSGIALHLEHVGFEASLDPDGEIVFDEVYNERASYKILKVNCGYLSVEEFADACGVEKGTINVWIRRGKLRTALKADSRWLIPELTQLRPRSEYTKYGKVKYAWDIRLHNLPKGFEDLAAPGELTILKVPRLRDRYVAYWEEAPAREEKTLTKLEVAVLETYLIANPLVTYTGDRIPVYS